MKTTIIIEATIVIDGAPVARTLNQVRENPVHLEAIETIEKRLFRLEYTPAIDADREQILKDYIKQLKRTFVVLNIETMVPLFNSLSEGITK